MAENFRLASIVDVRFLVPADMAVAISQLVRSRKEQILKEALQKTRGSGNAQGIVIVVGSDKRIAKIP